MRQLWLDPEALNMIKRENVYEPEPQRARERKKQKQSFTVSVAVRRRWKQEKGRSCRMEVTGEREEKKK